MIALLNDAHRWNLSEEEQQQYATEVAHFVPEDCQDQMAEQIITNYHADHKVIEQLRTIDHPQHDAGWAVWMSRAAGIIRQAGFAWSNDPAIDTEDLAQIAQVELIRSISSFTYHSRLSTWTYRVVVRSIQRFVRDSKAGKRGTRPDSLDHTADLDVPLSETDQPESQAAANVLAARTLAILAEHNNRLALIFKLWAIQDQRIEEIAEVVRLHPSRVRTLLKQARDILLAHPDMRDWRSDERHPDENAQ
ncbi:MAG TPA: sigma-70 family RNA polymerase sigma factor [Herpetosiphonaceae bacterium]